MKLRIIALSFCAMPLAGCLEPPKQAKAPTVVVQKKAVVSKPAAVIVRNTAGSGASSGGTSGSGTGGSGGGSGGGGSGGTGGWGG